MLPFLRNISLGVADLGDKTGEGALFEGGDGVSDNALDAADSAPCQMATHVCGIVCVRCGVRLCERDNKDVVLCVCACVRMT